MMNKSIRAMIRMKDQGYTFDSVGNVLNPKGKIVGSRSVDGYIVFSFRPSKEENPIQIGLHRFVAFLKYGDLVFDSKVHCRHLNDVKSDNKPENISIGTPMDNYKDQIRNNIDRKKRYDKKQAFDFYIKNGFNNTVKKYGMSKTTMSYIVKKYEE